MSHVAIWSLNEAADLLDTTVDEVKFMMKRSQLEEVMEEGEAFVSKRSVAEFLGEEYSEEPELISKEEAANIIGVSEASIYAYANQGKIKKVDDQYDRKSVLKYKANRDNNAANGKGGLRTAKVQAIHEAKEQICYENSNEEPKAAQRSEIVEIMEENENIKKILDYYRTQEKTYSQEHIELIKENANLKGKLEVIEKIYPELKGITHGSI
ncbi:hypothetical protein PGH07_07945 [Sulfurovum sp. zt1-1]|uniref:Helix-turn-helix domain-containing protein n=1 Tax=Sulfurovum zhangzhouensis TaxID=3019067 RepID=A0ABT7QZZ8_9BACT|nr:hypothetical protein [Sulfurovum zhangzhouensis]MDM5272109.1 hypothetical protein [Sulfurovum zhangzhouensis]